MVPMRAFKKERGLSMNLGAPASVPAKAPLATCRQGRRCSVAQTPSLLLRGFPIRRRSMSSLLIACLLIAPVPHTAQAAGKAHHIVVLVWDGMRPDFVTPEYTPNLHALAREGAFFQNHHPVYLSATEVN